MKYRLMSRASKAAIIGSLVYAMPAFAQDEASDSEDTGEIIVTAQKRAENVQSVPVSIAAFNSDTLEKQSVLTVMDLPRIASNFQSVRSSNTGSTRIGIRGVGSIANTLIEPSVAVFVDGVYVPRSGAVLGSFLDMAGIEVLRGPQGTLFGRNASVGALSLRTALPTDEFSGEVAGEVGSFERYKISGHVNVPLGENIAARFAGMSQWYKGPWKNRLDGKTYGGSDDVGFRGSLKAELGNVEWILRGDYSKIKGDGVVNGDFDPASVSPARLAFIQAAFAGGPDTNLNDRYMNQFMATGLIDKNWGLSSTATLDVAGSSLRLINSYRVWDNDQLDGDVIFFPVSLASRNSLFKSKSHNHELQFISPEREWMDGRFDMVAGLYYFEEDFNLSEQLNMGSSYCGVLVPAGPGRTACANYYASTGGRSATDQDVFQNVRSIAVYGQGNIHFTDNLTLTIGGRWTSDKKRGSYAQASSAFTQALRATEALTFPKLSEDRFTYRLSLNYKPNEDVMLFANLSTGYKSGGYNSGGGSPALTPPVSRRLFDRETVKNYELGIKSSWLDRALKANLTLYRMDIGGFQDRAFDGVSFIVRNAGSLRQQGFEFDTVLAPSRNFSVTGSLAYLDSEFTDYASGANLPGLTGTQNLTGKPNTFSPKWVGNVSADWSGDIGSTGLGWSVNGSLSFSSDQYTGSQLDANPQTLDDGYALIGARATINGPDDRWSVSIFGRNLGNTHYRPLQVYQPLGGPLGLNNTVFSGSTAVRVIANEPRTYGLNATFRF